MIHQSGDRDPDHPLRAVGSGGGQKQIPGYWMAERFISILRGSKAAVKELGGLKIHRVAGSLYRSAHGSNQFF